MADRVHNLKCHAVYFDALECGDKTFEIRRDDRGYQTGDTLKLQRWDAERNRYTRPKRFLTLRVVWILRGGQFGIDPGYVAMSVEPIQ